MNLAAERSQYSADGGGNLQYTIISIGSTKGKEREGKYIVCNVYYN